MKKVFWAVFMSFLFILPSIVGAAQPSPAKIDGTVTVDGTALTAATAAGYTFTVTKQDGTAYVPAAEDTDGLNATDWYVIDIPIFDKNDQTGGASKGDTAVIHVYKNGTELTVISPSNGKITVGDSGSTERINVVAVSPLIQYTLTMKVTGSGSTNPVAGTHTYDQGTQVTIEATPAPSYQFSGWIGDVADKNSATTTVTMSRNKTVTASFTIIPRTLTMQVNGSGSTDPAEGSYVYDDGTQVTIEATPDTGSVFTVWTGDVADTSTATTTVIMDADKTVTANFIKRYTLTMAVSGSGSTDPAKGTHSYDEGTEVIIDATPNPSYQFSGWIGDVSEPSLSTTTVTMDADKTVTASFTIIPRTLTMQVIGNGSTDPDVGSYDYNDGTPVTIKATPDAGNKFTGWTGDVADTSEATTTVTMDADKTVTANFTEIVEYTLTMAVTGSGSTDPAVGAHTYNDGTQVNIEATPDPGYVFTGWTGDVADTSAATTTVTMDADKTVKANFRVPDDDNDGDNVLNREEWGPDGNAPTYDGDGDGIPDSEQDYVASGHTFDGQSYVTLAVPAPASLGNVEFKDNPSPEESPYVDFDYQFIAFKIKDIGAGGATTATLFLPDGAEPDTYYKYGPTPDDPNPHWYEFLYDGETGAEINGNVITLHFVDGKRGDSDLDDTNGIIVDPGAPAIEPTLFVENDDGPCFIATAAYGSKMEQHVKVLRDFRNRFLLTNTMGKAFVNLYYSYSPTAADFIAKHDSLRAPVRWTLLPFVGMSWMTLHFGPAITLVFMLLILTSINVPVVVLFRKRRLRGKKT